VTPEGISVTWHTLQDSKAGSTRHIGKIRLPDTPLYDEICHRHKNVGLLSRWPTRRVWLSWRNNFTTSLFNQLSTLSRNTIIKQPCHRQLALKYNADSKVLDKPYCHFTSLGVTAFSLQLLSKYLHR